MIPKTEIHYSFDYAERLYKGDKPFSEVWQDIITAGGNFEEVYDIYIEQILKAIPVFSGYPWEEHTDPLIPIYIVANGDSLSRPLTIGADEDTSVMLVFLMTNLVRQNLHYGFKTSAERASAVHKVVTAVAGILDLDLFDALQSFAVKYVEKYGEAFQARSWDLTQEPARFFLEKKN